MIDTQGHDLVVIAKDPQEMADSQHSLILSVAGKLSQAEAEVAEAKDIIAAAEMAKIDDSAAQRLLSRAKHRVLYLTKVHEALANGYLMMPNLPGNTIAIRVNRGPSQKTLHGVNQWAAPEAEPPGALAVGEGKYVQPRPSSALATTDEGGGKRVHNLIIGEFNEEIGLPVEFLKPLVIKRTGEALELKIFDELVIVDNSVRGQVGKGSTRKGDPLVIGRIHDWGHGRGRYKEPRRTLTFLIAWFVDTATI